MSDKVDFKIRSITRNRNFPDTEFKEMIIRMLTKLESAIEELRENFNKESEGIIKNQAELKNTITEMKNTRRNQQQIS